MPYAMVASALRRMHRLNAMATDELGFGGEFRSEEGVWVLEVGSSTTELIFE